MLRSSLQPSPAIVQIGHYHLSNPLVLAPMAGITDLPFRRLCKQFGVSLCVSEMVTSNPALRGHQRTLLKAKIKDEPGLRSVQILGTEPKQMADAARFNASQGADIIDINMGCPAKKVCSVAAGSALLKHESLVKRILEAVVKAAPIPVTLKIRTGWDKENRNAVAIAKIAEQAGIAALTVHGRTRACQFNGEAEYDTIKQVKESVRIPVIANGDIDRPEKARSVLAYTGADAVMIGRAAQGNPWLFQQTGHFLRWGEIPPPPDNKAVHEILASHLEALYCFYGDSLGVRIARKHIAWYGRHTDSLPGHFLGAINQAQQPKQQMALIDAAFNYDS